jgi:regulator of protease activity HflC (stomatin/prohibitin superfamily)
MDGMHSGTKIALGVTGLCLVGAIGFGLFTNVVETNSTGLKLTSGGSILADNLAPGRYFTVPLYTRLVSMPRAVQTYISDKSETGLSDGIFYAIRFSVNWRITDAGLYYKSFGGRGDFAGDPAGPGTNQIDNIVYAHVKEAMRNVDSQAVLSTTAEQLFKVPLEQSNAKLKEFGLEALDVGLPEIDLNTSAKDAALEQQVQKVKTQVSAIKADGDVKSADIRAETTRKVGETLGAAKEYVGQVRGQADAEALRLLGQAVPDTKLYGVLRAAEAVQNLPKGSKVMIGTDSPLYQYLQGRME